MKELYFDANVIVPCYCKEIHTEKVKKFVGSLNSPPLITPLTLVEFYSGLSKKIRSKDLKQEEAKKISVLFKEHLKKGIYKKISMPAKHYLQAKTWLEQFHGALNLRTLDALHLSVAAKNGFELITLDKNLATAANFFKIQCNSFF